MGENLTNIPSDDLKTQQDAEVSKAQAEMKGQGSAGKGGRQRAEHVRYSEDVADQLCAYITEGKSLRTIAKIDGMPAIATVFRWLDDQPGFREQYTRAKTEQADTNAEDLQEIVEQVRSGELDPQSARVAADILKWTASKLKPKVYGDKLDLTSDGKVLPAPIFGGNSLAAPDTSTTNS